MGFFSFHSVLQPYERHQLGTFSDPCIQNQSKADWHVNGRANMTTWPTIQLLILWQWCTLQRRGSLPSADFGTYKKCVSQNLC